MPRSPAPPSRAVAALGLRARRAALLLLASTPDGEARDLLRAAARVLLRCVVLRLAELRGLLPPRLPALVAESTPGKTAWTRLLEQFAAVRARLGGDLFAPGDDDAHALAALERRGPGDAALREALALIEPGLEDMSPESIGLFYEALLACELARAPPDDVVLALGLGHGPSLPLAGLAALSEPALAGLLAALTRGEGREADEDEPAAATDEAPLATLANLEAVDADDIDDATTPDAADECIDADHPTSATDEPPLATPRSPADVTRIDSEKPPLATPRSPADVTRTDSETPPLATSRSPDVTRIDSDDPPLATPRSPADVTRIDSDADQPALAASLSPADAARVDAWIARALRHLGPRWTAARLVRAVIAPGALYLTRAAQARKGSGSFYTRPELAGAVTRRALDPLLVDDADRVRPPEELLALRICDPSLGSGAFLIAALRRLTDALARSVVAHDRVLVRPGAAIVRLDASLPADDPAHPRLPGPPGHALLDTSLKTCLFRHVCERCLYGVDRDPLAVALAQGAVWLAVGDPTMPLAAGRLRCGDSLIGGWRERAGAYPTQAAARDAGDADHRGVHFPAGARGAALRAFRREHLRPARRPAGVPPGPAREALDAWCAAWFWPLTALASAPLPGRLHDLPAATRDGIAELRARWRFFHWELEFPEVFAGPEPGFSVILTNPPWEAHKPSSAEFFAAVDPLYRTLGKQRALARQRALFAAHGPALERAWLDYVERCKALSHWFRCVGRPFGAAADRRAPARPFRAQGGGDPNAYKLFLEQAHALLRMGGRLGALVPSGIYSDKATADLRALLLERCDWTHLYVFQNERLVFPGVHHSFKVAALALRKGGATAVLRTRFRVGPGDSPAAHELAGDLLDDAGYLELRPADLRACSPASGAIPELRSPRDAAVLRALRDAAVALGELAPGGWGVAYATEFHMSGDSRLFPPRGAWERQGYRLDAYGHLCRDAEGGPDVALPLYQGVMIGAFDFAAKAWRSGTGLRARWDERAWPDKRPEAQFYMALHDARARPRCALAAKPCVRRVARSTDTRTALCALVRHAPCGDKLSVLTTGDRVRDCALPAILNSFVYDWQVRLRAGGTQLDAHILFETLLPAPTRPELHALAVLALRLGGAAPLFAADWLALGGEALARPWQRLWAITPHERLRLRCIVDAAVAHLYGLTRADFRWIVRDCDHPRALGVAHARRLDPKGLWRVDRDLDPELRHPVLAQVAFDALQRDGLAAFLARDGGDGWALPEELRLADHDLGHDARAASPQPIAARLGPRLQPWQTEATLHASWLECRRHAEALARLTDARPRGA